MRVLGKLASVCGTVLMLYGCAGRTPTPVHPLTNDEMGHLRDLVARYHDSPAPPAGWHELSGDEIRERMIGHSYFGYQTGRYHRRFIYEIMADGTMRRGLGDLNSATCNWTVSQTLNFDCSNIYHQWYVLSDGPHLVMVRYFHGRRFYNILEEITFSDKEP